MTITYGIKYEKIEKENKALKKELAERDKYIERLEEYINLYGQFTTKDFLKLEEQQLYKEDFRKVVLFDEPEYILKDNLKYDKLPSKEEE